jgi:hypothetical protein
MQGLASHPKIVCVGNWNPDPLAKTAYSGWCGVLEQTMRDICTARHLPFVSVVKIAQDPACHGAGQNPGVQWHPNDEGHARYANVIFETVRPLLPAAVP